MAPKNKKKEVTAQEVPGRNEQPPPDWPNFAPLVSPLDLSLEETVPKQIMCIRNLWTSTLCRNYVTFLSSLPLTTTPGRPKKGDAVRVNDRYQIDDPVFATRLWNETALKYLVSTDEGSGVDENERVKLWGGEVVGLNPNIRIYRYKKGHFFDQHYDDSNNVNVAAENGQLVQAKTTWTLLLYLTSPATGCIGGETVFYPDPPSKKAAAPDPIAIGLEVGMALLHKHGKDCMLHEGREVTAGEKWVIRSDLCVKR
ncbi:hypothetical protein, variant 2 [Verruconis gallopava]|uniref:Prolyl 4-hydroxylase alpha subunit domain-containing protein n=1 Tax=Verruconis gallopava TaxID=253628 RepID=A0A0D2A802_9PEZI|nr:uncharacterized protein PV09_06150 [Verruconis gallopava]XP_016212584.1 hypothetical protein, variant 1 [Verruconis gallopava]XP_016212585.1 hypothetical protein, variant 2 [Verruconis gallopava]KIW02714.1 hypothetical protein PV09_06150 [Verruconis gallopava]KIW02715.1 hypothetical protein, variant 1 [Verruconis gallopava]KIW02716.1 hypothetical protein, variant 2 [Verruconis gallopava]